MVDSMLWPMIIIASILLAFIQILRKVLRPKIVDFYSKSLAVSSSGHHFVSLIEGELGHYCNVCENGMQTGLQCDYCGVIVDSTSCLRILSSRFSCKVVVNTRHQILHHWVHGNLPSCSVCIVCDELCGDGVGLVDYRCSFCQVTVHSLCKHFLNEECDMGVNKDFIIPPTCVVTRKSGSRRNKHLVVESIQVPRGLCAATWLPLFVIINLKSGGSDGYRILTEFRLLLHPVQVINIEQVGIGTALRWLNANPEINCRILIAGGDGTISLVLDALAEFQARMSVAILPIGTGNDLSRTLGWGVSHTDQLEFSKVCLDLRQAKQIKLDRWSVEIVHRRRLGVRAKNKRFSMVNYISVGVDACVTYSMQSTRESIRRIVSSRFFNKLLFFTFGTKDVLEHACANLESKIELSVDGEVITLPPVEGLTILNIIHWGAGVKPWSDASKVPQAINDKKFEIFGVRSSFHIAQLQVGVSQAIPIAQGSTIKLRIFGGTLPMQVDGEAWLQAPGMVHVTHQDQASMLIKKQDMSEMNSVSLQFGPA